MNIVEKEADYTIRLKGEGDEVAEGVFRFRALDEKAEHLINLRAANMAGGAPWDSLPEFTQIKLVAMATLEIATVESPDWFKTTPLDLAEWPVDVLALIAQEARKHTAGYFRRHAGAGGVEAIKRGLAGRVVVASAGD